jgi:ATP-dependent exoDNAse (exonuclease V) beta subunit
LRTLDNGQLASGYIDLVVVEDGRVDIIDFKTDNSPTRPVEQTYPKYAAQVRIYGKLIETAGILKDRHLRCGLLFTADGSIRWIDL